MSAKPMNLSLTERQKVILRESLVSSLKLAVASAQQWRDSGEVIPAAVPEYVREVRETLEQVEQAIHGVDAGRELAPCIVIAETS